MAMQPFDRPIDLYDESFGWDSKLYEVPTSLINRARVGDAYHYAVANLVSIGPDDVSVTSRHILPCAKLVEVEVGLMNPNVVLVESRQFRLDCSECSVPLGGINEHEDDGAAVTPPAGKPGHPSSDVSPVIIWPLDIGTNLSTDRLWDDAEEEARVDGEPRH